MRVFTAFVAILAMATSAAPAAAPPSKPKHTCSMSSFMTYTRAVYERRVITRQALHRVDRLRACLRPWALRWQHRLGVQRQDRLNPWSTALASWYSSAESHGQPACGRGWVTNGIAHKTLPCGTRVRICARACATGVVHDRGPYIAGREFDLTPGIKGAVGCLDLCRIRWRIDAN